MNDYQKALKWVEEHPGTYQLFINFAHTKAYEKRRFGIGQLTERVRWEANNAEWDNEKEKFKISHNHKPYIARMLLYQYPALRGYLIINRLFGKNSFEPYPELFDGE